jgi:hypothetical protein
MFSPRFAGQPRDRALNPDGTPRSCADHLPALDDAEARWYFALEPDAAPDAPADELAEIDDAHAAEWDAYCRTLLRPSGLDTRRTSARGGGARAARSPRRPPLCA